MIKFRGVYTGIIGWLAGWLFSRWYLQNCSIYCHQTWYSDALPWAKHCFAIFSIKVTVMAHIIKMWLYLSAISTELSNQTNGKQSGHILTVAGWLISLGIQWGAFCYARWQTIFFFVYVTLNVLFTLLWMRLQIKKHKYLFPHVFQYSNWMHVAGKVIVMF